MALPGPIALEDILILTRTVWGEARGESYLGKRAVAHVYLNRWVSSRGKFAKDDTLATACLRHLQASAWNIGDANFEKMQTVDFNDEVFRECHRAVVEALDETPDPTQGATHYHASHMTPDWVKGEKPCFVEGKHLFYNTVP